MSKVFSTEYSSRARQIALKYPFATSVTTQINFWTIGYILLSLIIYLGTSGITKNMGLDLKLHYGPPLVMAIILGLSYGFIIGTVYYYLETKIFSDKPLWLVIMLQALLSIIVLLSLIFITTTLLFERLMIYFKVEYVFDDKLLGWPYMAGLIILYTFMLTLLISFINQMNRKFGPGILIPMLLGRFRQPREEERIFMFLDLNNSTSLAEKLGHVEYSSFVRDCFKDINHVVQKYVAEIYQYVGDEIVLSWNTSQGLEKNRVLHLYFSCKERFEEKKSYYITKYGVMPEFKAGAHVGIVTVVEVGDIKRDIAYHGDTLNVASRLEQLCKSLDKEVIISGDLKDRFKSNDQFTFKDLGQQNLRGRQSSLKVYSLNI